MDLAPGEQLFLQRYAGFVLYKEKTRVYTIKVKMVYERGGELMENWEVIKHYRKDKALRDSFNALAEKTFGLNFEGWYQNGFWTDNYDPYSIVVDGKVVANVSVNRTDMLIGGERKHLIQLGTVMTEESWRNRGLIRIIMQEVWKDHGDADGVYLFGSDSVVNFYPKFGFVPGKEYQYSKRTENTGACDMEQIPMASPTDWAKLRAVMERNAFRSGCEMVSNSELFFFYISQFMQDCVFYSEALNAYAVAEQEGESLFLHTVFAEDPVALDDVIKAFGGGVKAVTLGFAPADADSFERIDWHEEDCNFFVMGPAFDEFQSKALRIPTLAHA